MKPATIIDTWFGDRMDFLDIGKKIIQAVQASDNVAANQLILEFQGKALELQAENYQQRRRIDELERIIADKGSLAHNSVSGLYYKDGDPVPFCPKCFETKDLQVHLEKNADRHTSSQFKCVGCGRHFC